MKEQKGSQGVSLDLKRNLKTGNLIRLILMTN